MTSRKYHQIESGRLLDAFGFDVQLSTGEESKNVRAAGDGVELTARGK